ncbi:MAG: Re/Si-specific NAD(P)(+) transhydrogenase subunit alpha [candidate division WOR-3 bacterium]
MKLGVLKEKIEGEKRVSIIPDSVSILKKAGIEVFIEENAGNDAGFFDEMYKEKGAEICERKRIYDECDIIVCIRKPPDLTFLREKQILIGMIDPFTNYDEIKGITKKGILIFSLELLPRITRAQNMDVLSSMATISGYKAVLLAAHFLPKMFPMLMTAAGTITPARVFVIGAGVAGLQAIATAKRLGAVVYAYDIRPAVKEEVESLGAKFVEIGLETKEAEDKGGYAKEMGEEFYRKQREMMKKMVVESDVVISTALVPGKKAPVLITEDMIKEMKQGSVIVDLASERGGNCELTEPDKIVKKYDVTIIGLTNLPSLVPYNASQMYSKNITNFILYIFKKGKIDLNLEDEIIRDTLVLKDGEIFSPRFKEIMGI